MEWPLQVLQREVSWLGCLGHQRQLPWLLRGLLGGEKLCLMDIHSSWLRNMECFQAILIGKRQWTFKVKSTDHSFRWYYSFVLFPKVIWWSKVVKKILKYVFKKKHSKMCHPNWDLSLGCKNSLCCCPVTQSRLTLCDTVVCSIPGFPVSCNTVGFPVLHCLLGFAQTHVHWVNDAIQPFHPLSPPSLPALNLS